MSELLVMELNGVTYKFEHGKCRCLGHCNGDDFYVGEKYTYINESNSERCNLMESIFNNEVYKVEPFETGYKIWVDKEDDTPSVLRFCNNSWELISMYEYENRNDNRYDWTLEIPEYGEFLSEWGKGKVNAEISNN